jgi:hypothetical protein
MKRSQLAEIIREIVGGYEPDGKGNLVRHNDTFDSVKLSAILKGIVDRDSEEEKYEGDAERGNAILDKANPENVDRITRGEDPIYEGEGDTMDLQQLIDYIKELSPEVQLWVPTLYPGGFGKDQQTRRTVDQAVQSLTDVLDSPDHNQEMFKLTQDSPTFKSFSVIVSPEELERRTAMVRSMGSLD